MLDIDQLHQRVLYPVVRVRTEKAGGSGTVIYSQPNPEQPDEFLSFVLTNEHVIDAAVSLKTEYNSMLKKDVKTDILAEVKVELFEYVHQSTVDSSNEYRANIIAYDKSHDLAILRLDSPRPVRHVVNLVPRERIRDLRLFMPVVGCGCSLLHDPFAMDGRITSLREIIENKDYLMTGQNCIFGNSGGAVFLAETGEQIGVTARITGIQLGFGQDIMTWMSFAVHPDRIYQFLEEQELRFIYDTTDTYGEALKRREKRRKQTLLETLGQGEEK